MLSLTRRCGEYYSTHAPLLPHRSSPLALLSAASLFYGGLLPSAPFAGLAGRDGVGGGCARVVVGFFSCWSLSRGFQAATGSGGFSSLSGVHGWRRRRRRGAGAPLISLLLWKVWFFAGLCF